MDRLLEMIIDQLDRIATALEAHEDRPAEYHLRPADDDWPSVTTSEDTKPVVDSTLSEEQLAMIALSKKMGFDYLVQGKQLVLDKAVLQAWNANQRA